MIGSLRGLFKERSPDEPLSKSELRGTVAVAMLLVNELKLAS
jgi:hypothetical protein